MTNTKNLGIATEVLHSLMRKNRELTLALILSTILNIIIFLHKNR